MSRVNTMVVITFAMGSLLVYVAIIIFVIHANSLNYSSRLTLGAVGIIVAIVGAVVGVFASEILYQSAIRRGNRMRELLERDRVDPKSLDYDEFMRKMKEYKKKGEL